MSRCVGVRTFEIAVGLTTSTAGSGAREAQALPMSGFESATAFEYHSDLSAGPLPLTPQNNHLNGLSEMPQLSGPEQRVLVELLVAHLSEPGHLDRPLLHSGLGTLSQFTEKGTLGAMTSDLVRVLSNQYRVVEFIDAVLQGDFLKGNCPPIEKWLDANRTELIRRKLNPTITERLVRLYNPIWSRWLVVPIVAVTVACVYLIFVSAQRTTIGPLQGQLIDLQNSAPVITMYQSRPTRGMRDLTDEIGQRADSGAFGSIFICNPLEAAAKSPAVDVKVISGNGQHLDDPDGIFEIHWLPPDQDREELGRWGPKLHLKDGVVTDKYDGLVPVGTIITVVYQSKKPQPFPLTFNVWLR